MMVCKHICIHGTVRQEYGNRLEDTKKGCQLVLLIGQPLLIRLCVLPALQTVIPALDAEIIVEIIGSSPIMTQSLLSQIMQNGINGTSHCGFLCQPVQELKNHQLFGKSKANLEECGTLCAQPNFL